MSKIEMVGTVKEGFVFHCLVDGNVVQPGGEVTVDITSQEFKRQWWKLDFVDGYFEAVGGELDFKAIEKVAPKPKEKTKAPAKAEVE